jgi:hypothetical protein
VVPFAVRISNAAFCIYGVFMVFSVNRDISLNSINQLVFVVEKCCVFFEARVEVLNIELWLQRVKAPASLNG